MMVLTKPGSVTVAHSCGVICGKRIDYSLLRKTERCPIYRLRISLGDESSERRISADITKAARIYSLVVNNTVTPCTLDDVLDDILLYAEEIFVK